MGGTSRIRVDSEPWKVGIIGAGILGLATARALENRGVSCEIFEPGAPGGGQSRGPVQAVTFSAFDARVAQLKSESLAGWRRWERELGVELFSQRGMVLFGREVNDLIDDGGNPISGQDFAELPESDLETFLPTGGSLRPAAMLDRRGGAIWSQRTIGFLLRDLAGPVIPLEATGTETLPDGRVRIHAGEMSRDYDAAVVCAGTATGGFAERAGVPIPMTEVANAYATFPLRPALAGSRMAGFSGSPDGGDHAHGAPTRDNLRYRVMLDREVKRDPGGSFGAGTVEALGDVLDEWVEAALPGLDPHGRQIGVVRLSRLSWENPHGVGIGIWRQGPLLFPAGAPMFLSAPQLGEILADCAEGSPVPERLRPEAKFGSVTQGRTSAAQAGYGRSGVESAKRNFADRDD